MDRLTHTYTRQPLPDWLIRRSTPRANVRGGFTVSTPTVIPLICSDLKNAGHVILSLFWGRRFKFSVVVEPLYLKVCWSNKSGLLSVPDGLHEPLIMTSSGLIIFAAFWYDMVQTIAVSTNSHRNSSSSWAHIHSVRNSATTATH